MNSAQRLLFAAGACFLLNAAPAFCADEPSAAPTPAPLAEKKAQLPPGRHRLLERFTAQFGLTYDQQLQIEPLLHDEESVTKPILAYKALSPEEKQAMLKMVKIAARRQIRALLTPEQQKKMDEEIEQVSKGGKAGKKSGAGKSADSDTTKKSAD